ncbi:DUF4156 domain-containing protein [Bacteriovorax sp. DB6_IX]|uniref:DUF4156 domain-containing protein n=1 Tax=Bacteriovorax sp. DB6_IX TaxID=1353530 RepID=UPI00038A03BA|nr:DUF4156 domain-containing protein [Bacteriovorax sp. DB6_IX]EQC51603.1 PF13698 domain protein [Bacteriovorax sp. DB6_IX]
MKKVLFAVTAAALMTSCAVSKTVLTPEGEKIKVVNKKPHKRCRAVISVVGENDEGVMDLAINHARNQAGKKGADTLYVTDEVSQGSMWRVHATGYICKK